MISFAVQTLSSYLWSHLSTGGINSYTTRKLFRKSFPVPISSNVFTTFFFVWFRVSRLMLKSLIFLEFCAGWVMWIYFRSSTCSHWVEQAPFVEGSVFSSGHIFGLFFKNQVDAGVQTLIWVPSSIPSINVSDFIFSTVLFFITIGLKARDGNYSGLFWLSWITRACVGVCVSIWNLRWFFSISVKNYIGLLVKTV